MFGQYSVAGLGGSGSGGQLNFNGQKGSNTQSNPTRWVAEETSSDTRDGYAEGSAGMRAAGGTSFFASGYGAGADGFWSSSDTSGGSGSDGVVVVLEF